MEVSFEFCDSRAWGILGRLARDGFVLPPEESRDVITDFTTDVLPSLSKKYDPLKGSSPDRYLYSAFYKYARRRAVDWQHQQARLRYRSDFFEIADDQSPADEADRQNQLTAVRNAITRLPTVERDTLWDFLSYGRNSSERELASRHSMTRHELRETLANAVGRVFTEISTNLSESLSGRVASALWVDGRTPRDTAILLGTTTHEIQKVRQQLTSAILKLIRKMPAVPGDQMPTPLSILKNALLSHNEQLVEEVRLFAFQIRNAMETEELEFTDLEIQQLLESPKRVAEVYAAVAGSEHTDERDSLAHELDRLRNEHEEEIVEAFVLCIQTLPERFHDWNHWFRDVPDAPNSFQQFLREKAKREMRSEIHGLIRWGLTPTVFIEAARGLELLCDRILEDRANADSTGRIPVPSQSHEIHISLPGYRPRDVETRWIVSQEEILAQLRGTPQCPPKAIEPLLKWFVEALQLKPYLVRNYCASTTGQSSVRLKKDEQFSSAIVARWTRKTYENIRVRTTVRANVMAGSFS
jgi:hypothetical protein